MKARWILGVSLIAGGIVLSGAASSDTDIIKMRQQLMESNQQAGKVASMMVRGTTPYDATILAALMGQIAHETSVFPTLFLDADKTNPASNALPAVYTDNATFKGIAAKMVKDATAAADAASKGADVFRKAFGEVAGNCEDCHEMFRKPQ